MSEMPRSQDTAPPGMPRWVKIFLIVVVALAVAFVVTRLLGVEHGPGLHGGGGATPTPAHQHATP